MIGVVAVLLIALVLVATLLITGNEGRSQVSAGDRTGRSSSADGEGDGASDGSTPLTSTTTTSTTTSTTFPTTATTLPPLGDVRLEPPGLTCRALASRRFPYPAAVTYWQVQGQPARMDVDGNGRPCETVYPPEAVGAFWQR